MNHNDQQKSREERVSVMPTASELSRLSVHQRQVAYVRASLLRGITHDGATSKAGPRRHGR
jgi:hypothetical protein